MNMLQSVLCDGMFAAVAAIGFAAISNPPKRAIFISALLAAIAHAIRYYLLNRWHLDITSATFLASFPIGMMSILIAKLVRYPAEIFAFPSLLPMIPGMYAYKTILALMKFMTCGDENQQTAMITEIFRNGLTTVFVMFAMVVGVAVPLFMFRNIHYTRGKTDRRPDPKEAS